ncbi:hypothetical protein ACS0TY_023689 [Phlomoides rotata]
MGNWVWNLNNAPALLEAIQSHDITVGRCLESGAKLCICIPSSVGPIEGDVPDGTSLHNTGRSTLH